MSAIENIGNFSFGLLPFTFGERMIETKTSQEKAVVRMAKTLGAAVMTINSLWDVVNISNTVTDVMLSTDANFDFLNFGQDLTSLTVSAVWAGSNTSWIKRYNTVRN